MHQLEMETFRSAMLPRLDSEERPWGRWSVLDEGEGYKVKMIEVAPGHRLSLQYHHYRSEYWVVVQGKARIVIGNQHQELGPMQAVMIPERTIHRIENPYAEIVRVLEVQQGSRLEEDDIVRLEDDYHRARFDARAD